MNDVIDLPEWIPASGHQLGLAGAYFDAVRIEGVRGELVATRLMEAADGDAGPIVCEVTGFRWMYFLLAPGEVRRHNWPLGVQQFGGKGVRTAACRRGLKAHLPGCIPNGAPISSAITLPASNSSVSSPIAGWSVSSPSSSSNGWFRRTWATTDWSARRVADAVEPQLEK